MWHIFMGPPPPSVPVFVKAAQIGRDPRRVHYGHTPVTPRCLMHPESLLADPCPHLSRCTRPSLNNYSGEKISKLLSLTEHILYTGTLSTIKSPMAFVHLLACYAWVLFAVYGAIVGCSDLPSDWLISIKRMAFLAAAAAGCK